MKANVNYKRVYSWEVSTPNEFGIYSAYTKLTDNSLFSFVNESVLESIYYQPKFRVRCIIQLNKINQTSHQVETIKTLKSSFVEIASTDEETHHSHHYDGKLSDHRNKCVAVWKERTRESAGQQQQQQQPNITNGGDSLLSSYYYSHRLPAVNFKFDKPFMARADYISAEFIKNNPNQVDLDYLNYIRLTIEIPFVEGTVPLISTTPLHNYRHLLKDEFAPSLNHLCSNFIDLKSHHINVKYGFVKLTDEQLGASSADVEQNMINEQMNKYRNRRTMAFYANLDRKKCVWKFVAYYDLTELTTYCQAQIISSDLESKEDFATDKSYLIIKIPLYVSYVFASHQAAWSSFDYKSNVEASIIYKTRSLYAEIVEGANLAFNPNDLISANNRPNYDSNANVFSGTNHFKQIFNEKSYTADDANLAAVAKWAKNEHIVSLSVSKISMSESGKLVIEFSTVPAFHGI